MGDDDASWITDEVVSNAVMMVYEERWQSWTEQRIQIKEPRIESRKPP